jgi:hypothetical protein
MQLLSSLQAAARLSQRQPAALAGGGPQIPAALAVPIGGLYHTNDEAAVSSPTVYQAGNAAAGGPQVRKQLTICIHLDPVRGYM